MQVLAKTEYQDIYRITSGVLLIVNKFVPIENESNKIFINSNMKLGKYNKDCQDGLKVLKSDYDDDYNGRTYPKGTVLYNRCPVKATTNEEDFEFQIKTSGDAFSGDKYTMDKMLSDILYRIRQGKCK